MKTTSSASADLPPPLQRDALLPYFSDDTPLGRLVKHHIQEEGYVVIPSILTAEECAVEFSRLWDFVEATSPGVSRDDPDSWYPAPPSREGAAPPAPAAVDAWPHSGWAFLPDMCQSFQAGWLFGRLRETLAERVFAPLYGTARLHSSKEGFTFHRPTAPGLASNGAVHPVLGSPRPRVAGKVQVKALGEHFDQCAAHTGLQCIQSSTALLDQDMDGADGCFRCWPRSHVEHPRMTRDIWRGRSDWVPLTDEELLSLEDLGLSPRKVPVNAGDVILWRSDLVHCGVGPSAPRTNFRAVAYTCMLPAALTSPHVVAGKLGEYLEMRTGDHRPNVRSRHFAPPKKDKTQRGARGSGGPPSAAQKAAADVKLARGKYFADGPPVLTWRQAELYGLVPYDRSDGDFEISSQVRVLDAEEEEANSGTVQKSNGGARSDAPHTIGREPS